MHEVLQVHGVHGVHEVLRELLREVDCDDVVAQAHAKLRNRHVLRIRLICVQRGAIPEFDDERGVVRPGRVHDVGADCEVHDPIEPLQSAKTRTMLVAGRLRNVRLVLEANNVSEHIRVLR